MLRSLKSISKIYSLDEDKFRNFVKENKYELIPLKDDYLANPWTYQEIVNKYRSLNKPFQKKSKTK